MAKKQLDELKQWYHSRGRAVEAGPHRLPGQDMCRGMMGK